MLEFLHLPCEIRLNIYEQLFGEEGIFVNAGRQDVGHEAGSPSLLPCSTTESRHRGRSGQLLRACKTILAEGRPVLYRDTIFHNNMTAFAGRLPIALTNDLPSFKYIRHVRWQLRCDLLKRYDAVAVKIDERDVQDVQSIELVCQAESWKESIRGAWVDQNAFLHGRQQVLDFATLLQSKMSSKTRPVVLVEDTGYASRGKVVLRLTRGRYSLGDKDVVIA